MRTLWVALQLLLCELLPAADSALSAEVQQCRVPLHTVSNVVHKQKSRLLCVKQRLRTRALTGACHGSAVNHEHAGKIAYPFLAREARQCRDVNSANSNDSAS